MNRMLLVICSISAVTGLFAAQLQNAAQTSLGATGTFSGVPNNKDWPANRAIPQENPRDNRGGCLFGAPVEGETMHIRLLAPCDIERIDLKQLDYHYTMNVKKVELSVDGKVVKTCELEEKPNVYQEVPLKARGSVVSIKCLETFPRRKNPKTGQLGANYGGWARVRVMVSNDIAALIEPPKNYGVIKVPEAVTPTGTAAAGKVKAFTRPRHSQGHPRTTWDKEDVAYYRSLLKKSPEFKRFAENLRRAVDKRMLLPLGIPQPKKGPDGEWLHLGDDKYGKIHNNLSLDIANLGTVYQLFGDEKYARFARRMLLEYADAWPKYGVGARATFRHDPSKVFDQRLGDSTWLIQVAVGFDFVRESECFSAEDIKKISDDLVAGSARFIRMNRAHLICATNWSAIGTAAILAAAVACDDEDLFNTAMWGYRWMTRANSRKPEQFNRWWEGVPNANPQGIELHFSQKSIDVDGMWCEGAMGYQFMALQALVFDAEVLLHHGIDLYSYRGGALKGIFDSPILFSYPSMITPAIHDSGNAAIIGRESGLWEYGYLRYRDPSYLNILRRVGRRLGASFQQFTLSCLWDGDEKISASAGVENPSVNLNGVGYGILRVTDDEGTRNLLVDYGPNRSHGHPDKLNIDLWAFGALQIPDPGTAWYETSIYRDWFRTTFAHNTLSVDMQEQNACGAELLAFTPGEQGGLMRACAVEAYPGVIMDRSMFLTREYFADIFGAFARMPRTYDLVWHPRGKLVEEPAGMKPYEGLGKNPGPGYNQFKNVRAVSGSASRRMVFENDSRRYSLIMPEGAEDTDFVAGGAEISSSRGVETSVMLRRRTADSVFGGVFDLTGKVKSVRQTGSLKDGYGELEIRFTDGGVDRCAAGFNGEFLQKFVSVDGKGALKAIALSGCRKYAAAGCGIELESIGGAFAERTATGSWLVKNCSSVPNRITLSLKSMKKTFSLAPGAREEWLVNGAKPIAEHRRAMLAELAAKRAAAEAAAAEASRKRVLALRAQAEKLPGRKGTKIVVQAEDFAAVNGGTLKVPEGKTAAVGKSISHWDADGQSIEWKVDIPAAGYYNLSLVYCSDTERRRDAFVNSTLVTARPEGEKIPPTGGFSNGSDDWRVYTFPEESGERPLPIFFKQGENVIRLVNRGGGGVNLDYLLVTSMDTSPLRIGD